MFLRPRREVNAHRRADVRHRRRFAADDRAVPRPARFWPRRHTAGGAHGARLCRVARRAVRGACGRHGGRASGRIGNAAVRVVVSATMAPARVGQPCEPPSRPRRSLARVSRCRERRASRRHAAAAAPSSVGRLSSCLRHLADAGAAAARLAGTLRDRRLLVAAAGARICARCEPRRISRRRRAAGAHAQGKSRQRWPTRTASPMRSNASSAGPVLERVAALR